MNFIHEKSSSHDINLLFGPLEEEKFTVINDEHKLEDLMVLLGKFPSKNQARKNKWEGEIPAGFKEWKIGKTFFWTFKPVDDLHQDNLFWK